MNIVRVNYGRNLGDKVWLAFWEGLSEELRLFFIALLYLWPVLRPPEFRHGATMRWCITVDEKPFIHYCMPRLPRKVYDYD